MVIDETKSSLHCYRDHLNICIEKFIRYARAARISRSENIYKYYVTEKLSVKLSLAGLAAYLSNQVAQPLEFIISRIATLFNNGVIVARHTLFTISAEERRKSVVASTNSPPSLIKRSLWTSIVSHIGEIVAFV